MSKQVLTAIVKATNLCNYRCKYCFVEASAPKKKMTFETLHAIIEKLLSSVKYHTINFIWHGGEPLLCGLEFFNHVITLQKELNTQNKTYSNAIQTNGSLLNDEIINFFKKNHIKIGLSLDGPREINNITRLSGRYTGTYETTINKIRKIQKHGLKTGAIATITKYNYRYPKELYSLFKENKIHMKIGQLVNSGMAKFGTEEIRLHPKEYGKFATKLFELWFNDKENSIRVSPFESIMQSMIHSSRKPAECIFAGNCHKKFIAISPNGDIYPCGLYQGYEKFRYGNIYEFSMDKIEEAHTYKILEQRQKDIKRLCGGCAFFKYCHGGCPFSALSNNGNIFSKDYYCEAFKIIFQHILEKVNMALENLEDCENKVKLLMGGGGGGGDGYGVYTISYDVDYTVWDDYVVTV